MAELAERLRAIEAAMTPGPWRARRAHEGWDNAPVTDDAGMRAPDAAGCAGLRNALPAIARLVEVTETVAGYTAKVADDAGREITGRPAVHVALGTMVRRVLEALDG